MNKFTNKISFIVGISALCMLQPVAAQAQTQAGDERSTNAGYSNRTFITRGDVPVLGPIPEGSQSRPLVKEEDALSYSLLTLRMGAEAGIEFNDNIYKTELNEEGDIIGTFSPRVNMSSNFERHAIEADATGEIGRYFADEQNDYEDWEINVGGRYDLTDKHAFYLDLMHARNHVSIGGFEDDPSTTFAEPVRFYENSVAAGFIGSANRFHYGAEGSWTTLNYENVKRQNGGISIQDDRDQDEYDAMARLGYEFIPGYINYVTGGYNDRRYDERIDSSAAFSRDSDGYLTAIGVATNMPDNPFKFDGYLGYFDQDYQANELPDVDGLAAFLDASWNINAVNTVRLRLDRQVRDSLNDGVSSRLQTRVRADYDHDFNDVLSTGVNVGFTDSDFQTNTAIATDDRQDYIYDAGLDLSYEFAPDTQIEFGYNFQDRDSDEALASFQSHRVGLTFSIKY